VTDGRKHFPRALASLTLAAVGGSVLLAPAAQAAPDIDTVQQRVDSLDQQADQAAARHADTHAQLGRTRAHLDALRADLKRQRARVAGTRNRVAASAAKQSAGSDPDALVAQLSRVAAFNDQQRLVSTKLNSAARRLHAAKAATERRLAATARSDRRTAAEKARADADASRAQQLLQTMKDRAQAEASRSADRAAQASRSSDRTAVAASGSAATAVRYAMAQIGKSYVYGAAGPSAFDCSGLTMMAWAQAGVALPHSSGAQMGSGTPVSQSQLQPGDLVFYYSPVSHVGMYIGNGQIVNALNPGAGIRISALNSMPYAGAVRPG
jgi:cell wall-associated NlpC family hydrolase